MPAIGMYHFPDVSSPLAVHEDPRMERLRAAFPRWAASQRPEGGVWVNPHGTAPPPLASEPVTCADGLRYHPPKHLPELYDLAREEIPQPAADANLRRVGRVSLPLGVGPVFALGPRRGNPSSVYGIKVKELWERSAEKDRQWTADDDALTEEVIFLAFRQCYHLTWELWCQMAPYDLDETHVILEAVYGLDPKSSGGGSPT